MKVYCKCTHNSPNDSERIDKDTVRCKLCNEAVNQEDELDFSEASPIIDINYLNDKHEAWINSFGN